MCAGVSIERAFNQADVVMEVKLNPKIPTQELWIKEEDDAATDEQVGYAYVGLSFNVLRVWKGNSSKQARIYVFAMGTGGYHFEENQKYVVFARFFDRDEGLNFVQVGDRQEHHLLNTGYCRGNTVVNEDRASQLIRAKLDRIQAKAERPITRNEHAEALRTLIRRIIKSNKKSTAELE